jgi:hypothetical protein
MLCIGALHTIFISHFMSNKGSLKLLLSGARYIDISSISAKLSVLPAGQEWSNLNNIDIFHSSLTYISCIEMVAEPIVP